MEFQAYVLSRLSKQQCVKIDRHKSYNILRDLIGNNYAQQIDSGGIFKSRVANKIKSLTDDQIHNMILERIRIS